LIAIGLTMSAADEGFPARVPQSPLVKGPIHFPVPSAFGDWSEWSNGLRGRLLFGVPAGAVYLELENSGTDREIYYEVRQFFNPLSRDSLRGDLRDGAGNVLDVSHPGADKGLGPGPWWLLVQRDSTARFRVDLDAFRYLSRSDSLNVGLGFEQGNAWSIPRGMTDDCYLTATLTVIPPKDSQTPSGAPAWSGALKLPPVEIPKW
jgi:hypothetical protein